MKSHTLSFRGGGAAREPGTQEHGPIKAWKKLVFLGSGPGPSRHPGMPFVGITSKGFSFFPEMTSDTKTTPQIAYDMP